MNGITVFPARSCAFRKLRMMEGPGFSPNWKAEIRVVSGDVGHRGCQGWLEAAIALLGRLFNLLQVVVGVGRRGTDFK